MNQRILFVLLGVCCLLGLVLWLRYEQPPSGPLPESVLPRPAPEVPQVLTCQPLQRTITDHVEFIGKTEPGAVVVERARSSGTVAKVHCQPGAFVKKDAVLLELDQAPLQASLKKLEAQVKQQEEAVKKATAAYEKAEKGYENRKITQRELEKAETVLEKAEQALEMTRQSVARRKLDLELVTIKAPIAGRVAEVRVKEGDPVSADGTVVAQLESIDPLIVRVSATQYDVQRMRQFCQEHRDKLQDLRVVMELTGEKQFSHQGQFVSLEPVNSSGIMIGRVAFANPEGTLPAGKPAWVRALLGQPYQALLVTESAVVRESGKDYLLLVDERNRVAQRSVKLGPLHDGLRVVQEGLAADDWVVLPGAPQVREGETVLPTRAPMPVPVLQREKLPDSEVK